MSSKSISDGNFYEKSNDVGILCKLCKCSIKTNLANHLKRKHPSIHLNATVPKIRRNSLSSTTPTPGSDNEDDPNIVLPETHVDSANQNVSKIS